jgi:hypothetical protein
VGVFKVLHEVVFFSLLENTKLFVESSMEIFDAESSLSFLKLLEHSKSEAIFILSVHVPDFLLRLLLLKLSSHGNLVIKFVVLEFLVLQVINNGAILVSS